MIVLTSKRPAETTTQVAPSRGDLADGVIIAVLALSLLVFLAGMYPLRHWYFPVGPDTPVYLWWTRLATHDGLSAVGTRPGVPALVLMLAGTLHVSRVAALASLGPVGGITIGLAAAALVDRGSAGASGSFERRAGVIAAGLLAGTFAVHLADGWYANLIQAALFLAGAAAIAAGSMRGAAAAAGLLGASALAHPQFFLLSCAILLLTASLTIFRRGRPPLPDVEGGRILAALAGGGVLAAAGFGALALGPGLPRVDTSQDAFLRRAGLQGLLHREYRGRFVRHLTRFVLELQVPLAGLGLGETGGFLARFLGTWSVLLVVGVAISLVTGFVPAVRFFSFGYVLPILAGLGLVRLYRWGAKRRRAVAAVVAVAIGAGIVLGPALTWIRTKPFVSRTELSRAAVAGRIASAAPAGTPVVFVVDTGQRNVSFHATRANNVIRDAVPPSLIRRVHLYVGSAENYLMGLPTLTGGVPHDTMSRLYLKDVRGIRSRAVAFVLAPLNRPFFDDARGDGDLVSRGVIELRPHPPTPAVATGGPADLPPSTGWKIVLASVAALVLVFALGLGWARATLPGSVAAALAPAFGAGGLILGAILFERLGAPLTGWGPPVVSAVVAGGGYLAMFLRRRGRSRHEPGSRLEPGSQVA